MRLQLALNVDDLDQAIEFYSKMFGTQPAKIKPGYANFAIENPPLKLVLFEGAGQSGSINHLGVETETAAEVVAADTAGMLREAAVLRKLGDNICIKLPLTIDGLTACKALADDGVMTNVTLCFSANQALLAAKAGASFISPFVGRLDDVGFDGMILIEDIKIIYDNYAFETEILVASVRHPVHVLQAAKLGADVATMPPAVIRALANHPLTDKGLAAFDADWAKTGQSIV